MDKGKKEALKPLKGPNRFRLKRKKIEETSDGQKKEDAIERGCKRLQEENRLRKMKMGVAAGASAGKEEETKEDSIDLYCKENFKEILEGLETEYSTDETVVSTSEKFEVLCNNETVLSPKESSTKNPKGIKKQKNVVEQSAENNQEVKTVLFPKESSKSNPTGMKNKQVSEDEDEEAEEKKLISDSLSDDALPDACTDKFPISPIDKFIDSDKDEAMGSPPGDHGL